jgi:hypothetical protein
MIKIPSSDEAATMSSTFLRHNLNYILSNVNGFSSKKV